MATPSSTPPAARRAAPAVLLILAGALALAPGCVWFDAALGREHDVGAKASHFTRLWPANQGGEPYIGLSTEDGILLLTRPGMRVGDIFDIHFPIGNSTVRDWGQLDRFNENLAVVRPLTARQSEGRFAASAPTPGETIYVSLRDGDDDPVMEEADWWHDGEWGDWITVGGHDLEELAGRYAGTGVYVERDDRYEICGVLSGLIAHTDDDPDDDPGLGFYGLGELARILPDQRAFYGHDIRPLRPDFEFGVPLQKTDLMGRVDAMEKQKAGAGRGPAGRGGEDAGAPDADADDADAGAEGGGDADTGADTGADDDAGAGDTGDDDADDEPQDDDGEGGDDGR